MKKIVVPFSYRHSSCTTVNKPCSLKPEHKLVLKQKIAELKTKYAKAKVDSKTVITTLEEVRMFAEQVGASTVAGGGILR